MSAHVEEVRDREERIEKVVAVTGTALVVLVLMLAGGVGLVEGILMYGVAGAAMFYLAKKTFKPNREQAEEDQIEGLYDYPDQNRIRKKSWQKRPT